MVPSYDVPSTFNAEIGSLKLASIGASLVLSVAIATSSHMSLTTTTSGGFL